MSREMVKRALMITALNDFEVQLTDILNAYLQAFATEKVWTMLGHEFCGYVSRIAVIIRPLHGLKQSGAAFRSHLARCMESIGYLPCWADLYLLMIPETYLVEF